MLLMWNKLTYNIISKLVLSYVIKQGGKNWEQGDGGVVDVLGNAFDLLWRWQAAHSWLTQDI